MNGKGTDRGIAYTTNEKITAGDILSLRVIIHSVRGTSTFVSAYTVYSRFNFIPLAAYYMSLLCVSVSRIPN